MNLNKEQWTENDIPEFQAYLESLENKDVKKKEWASNILNTKMPVLVLNTKTIKGITSDIAKGNYLSFLDLMIWEYYENSAINGMLISKIKDFDTMKRYLDIYSEKADNWATCDLLSFNTDKRENMFLDLTREYIKSNMPFKRRIGINPLLMLVKKDEYVDVIFDILNSFKDEKEYYVNMINAWVLCECFIRHKEKTLLFLDNNNLNKFTINKAIAKCRESFRVSETDREMLLKYKR